MDLIECADCKKKYFYHRHPIFSKKIERSEVRDTPRNSKLLYHEDNKYARCGECMFKYLKLQDMYNSPGEDL